MLCRVVAGMPCCMIWPDGSGMLPADCELLVLHKYHSAAYVDSVVMSPRLPASSASAAAITYMGSSSGAGLLVALQQCTLRLLHSYSRVRPVCNVAAIATT